MDVRTQLGPFAVGERIGEGGMGVVYRGRHRERDVPVALKVIRKTGDRDARRRFHEEVQAHAGLMHRGVVYLFEYGAVDVAAAADTDGILDEGSPFVAMEWADAGTVRDAMPLTSWGTLRRLLTQILDALAHAHARGVVHRDLKPENLLLFDRNASGPWQVKLADFGVAHALEREADTDAESLSAVQGTPLYISPEQARAEWREYGPWTDLYALGCITWELVCGEPPFEEDGNLATILRHTEAERPPLEPNFPVPDELSDWVRRAMAIDPADRFRRAADAAWCLPPGPAEGSGRARGTSLIDTPAEGDRGGASDADETSAGQDGALETIPFAMNDTVARDEPALAEPQSAGITPGPDAPKEREAPEWSPPEFPPPPPIPEDWRTEEMAKRPAPLIGAGLGLFGLREPPFVDRRDECDRVWSILREVVESGGAASVFIVGEPGTGKSRLAEWLAIRAHEVGAVRTIRAVHTPAGGRSVGLRGALERTLRTVKLDRGEVYAYLDDQLPALEGESDADRGRDARALTEYLRPTADNADDVDGPPYRFDSARQRRDLLVRVLRRLADRRPVALWLDDLQWGAEATGLLEYLRVAVDDPPALLVLATLRSDQVPDGTPLADRLETLADASTATLSLEPLSKPHQRELLEGLLPLEPELAERLAERTEGHPRFAMQLLGHWLDRGDLVAGDDGFRVAADSDVELPEDLHQLWKERTDRLLESLPPGRAGDGLRALELGAALGREVDAREWRKLLRRAELQVGPDLVGRLVDRGLASRTAEGWSFTHGLLVESLERRAREGGRWTNHQRRCARMLASGEVGEEPGPRERIAEHWIAAGELEAALEPLLGEIRRHDEREEDAESRRLLRRRTEILDELDVARDDPRRLEQRIHAAALVASRGKPSEALAELADVRDALPPDEPRLLCEVAVEQARISMNCGERDRARDFAETAVQASRRAESQRLESQSRWKLAWLLFYEGDLEGAERHASAASDAADRAGDRYRRLKALRLLALIAEARGDAEAAEFFEKLRRRADRAGYVGLEAMAHNGLGEHARFAGRLDEARRHYTEYRKRMEELSRPLQVGNAELNLAQVEFRADAPDRGRAHLDAARTLLEEIGPLERWTGQFHALRLCRAAAGGRKGDFDELWHPLEDGWPESWNLLVDVPWLLEAVADYTLEQGWSGRRRDVLRLAADLWRQLDQPDAARDVDRRLDAVSDS